MKKRTILVAVLVAGGWLGAATVRAEVKADKNAAPAKQEAAKGDAEKKDAAKLGTILKDDELALMQKNYPKLVKDREAIEALQTEFKTLKDTVDPKEKKKADRKIPIVYKKLTHEADGLKAEFDKALKPLDSQLTRLKEQEGRLITAKDAAETAKKDSSKITADLTDLTAKLTDLDKLTTALKALCDVKVEKLEEKK